MSAEKEQISARQLMFSVVCFIQASSLISNFLTETTKQESWIAVIMGYILSLPILGMYAILVRAFPGKSIIEINNNVFGSILGRFLSLFYIFFFFSLAFLNTEVLGHFMTGFVMPKTPMIAVSILFIFVCAWAVRSGVETMTRYSTIFVFITFFEIFIITILLIKDMKPINLLPVFSLPLIKYIQSAHTMAALPCCEIFSFFMLFPYVKEVKKINSSLLKGMTLGVVTQLIIILRNTAVLGPLTSILSSPYFEAIRFIDVGHALTRMEILYAGILIMLIFFKVSITFFAAVKAIEQVFNLHSYRSLVPVVGVLIIISSIVAFGSAAESTYWGANVAAVYSTLFEVVLPGVTLLMMAYKKLVSSIV